MPELIDLVPSEFKDDLSEAEKLILEKAPKGEWADCREIDGKKYDVEKPEEWPECRTVRAKFLEWLLRDREAQKLIHDKGVRIWGIKVADELDLACIQLPFSIELFNCRFEGELNLYNAKVQQINLDSSFIAGMMADRMVVEASLFLKNIISRGEMRMVGANIGGNVACNGAKFTNENRNAFNGNTMETKGTVFFKVIESRGVFSLVNANVGSNLECNGAKFINEKGDAFSGDGMIAKGDIFLRGIESTGDFRLVGADIGGDLDCEGAKFMNKKGDAFAGDGIATKGDIFLREIESTGDFRLVRANVGANLSCEGAKFRNEKGDTFSGDGIATKGDIFLTGIESTGDFRLVGADIGSNLDCDGAKFTNENENAFSGDRISTKGTVFLRGIKSKGVFRLLNAHIGTDLYSRGASFENKEQTALRMTQAQIDGRLCLNKIKKINGKIYLSNAKAGALVDDDKSWPDEGKLIIDGFEYGSFADDTPTDIDTRLEWLKRQPEGEYFPQPYQQLAKVYRKMGRDRDAKKVLLEKERMRRGYGNLNWLSRIWGYFLDLTIGYGYRIGRAIGFVAAIILLGTLIFGNSKEHNILPETSAAASEIAKPQFNSLFYSIDVFVPFLDLHQDKYWMPDATTKWGRRVQFYCYFHIISGWVFSTLLVASFTGLIRRE